MIFECNNLKFFNTKYTWHFFVETKSFEAVFFNLFSTAAFAPPQKFRGTLIVIVI